MSAGRVGRINPFRSAKSSNRSAMQSRTGSGSRGDASTASPPRGFRRRAGGRFRPLEPSMWVQPFDTSMRSTGRKLMSYIAPRKSKNPGENCKMGLSQTLAPRAVSAAEQRPRERACGEAGGDCDGSAPSQREAGRRVVLPRRPAWPRLERRAGPLFRRDRRRAGRERASL